MKGWAELKILGPLACRADKYYTCDGCGEHHSYGSYMYFGRINGRPVHTCSKKCFEALVQAEKEVQDGKQEVR